MAGEGRRAASAGRARIELPDGTVVATDVAAGEPIADVVARLELALRQKGVMAVADGDAIRGDFRRSR